MFNQALLKSSMYFKRIINKPSSKEIHHRNPSEMDVLVAKSAVNGQFSMARLHHQRVNPKQKWIPLTSSEKPDKSSIHVNYIPMKMPWNPLAALPPSFSPPRSAWLCPPPWQGPWPPWTASARWTKSCWPCERWRSCTDAMHVCCMYVYIYVMYVYIHIYIHT